MKFRGARYVPAFLATSLFFVNLDEATAWDYLEHAWLTDVACREAQTILASELATNFQEDLAARYVALGVACPVAWNVPYCENGLKVVQSGLLEAPNYPMTLGDYSAMGDHVSRFGPVPGMPNARENGLIHHTLQWLTVPGPAGGTLETVAETACQTSLADFEHANKDIRDELKAFVERGDFASIPHELLHPGIRTAPTQGPSDPAAAFSFYNPHYLDLVLRNHTHFGDLAYAAWTGFHSAGLEVAARECSQVLDYSDSELKKRVENLAGFDAKIWDAKTPKQRKDLACTLLNGALKARAETWLHHAPAAVTDPVKPWLEAGFSARILPALLGLVMEGAGLHYLQDGLASGHMRTVRSRESLLEVRHDHDNDNLEGVVAVMDTRQQSHAFYAFGDTYLLGKPQSVPCMLSWDALSRAIYPIAEMVTNCTLKHQRGILAATSVASLVDWALGGPAFVESFKTCPGAQTARGFVCRALPLRPPVVSGLHSPAEAPEVLIHGTLPVPPRDYAYESLSIRAGLQVPTNTLQLGVALTFLEQLDTMGHWLTSWRAGLHTTLGDGIENQWVIDYAYQFHYRLSARFMFDAAPFVFAGLRNINEVDFFAGIGPSIGITALPEGWINLPLEFSVTYRLPLVFFSSENGFFSAKDTIDGHWIQLGIGLAYSH